MGTAGTDAGLHPTEGARFLFERQSDAGAHERAAYRAIIFTPRERFEYLADMTIDGGFELSPRGEPAAPELEARLGTIAKLIARSARSKLADELPPWPHRVLRWRGPGRRLPQRAASARRRTLDAPTDWVDVRQTKGAFR